MATKTITHVGPQGHNNDEEKAQTGFGQGLIDEALKEIARREAAKAANATKGGKK